MIFSPYTLMACATPKATSTPAKDTVKLDNSPKRACDNDSDITAQDTDLELASGNIAVAS